jgi:putative Holliday junction resolvase
MRVLGLDLGSKTLGISMSDLTETVASTFKTIRFESDAYDSILPEVKKIVDEFEVKEIVLGLPKNMNNTVGPRGELALQFKDKLQTFMPVTVIMQDERLSTVEATNYMIKADMSRKKRKEKIDSLAANIILQSYLDRKKGMRI